MNFRLIGPMQREIARLNFEGKLQAVAEEQGKATETLPFGYWNAVVSYGSSASRRRRGESDAGRTRAGCSTEGQPVSGDRILLPRRLPSGRRREQHRPGNVGTGQIPSALIDGKWQHRQFLRVEEGTYENGVFKLIRTWNGGETD